jgi:predicted Zn-dependent protease
VSDDDDLVSAYEAAQKDLQGNLKLTVTFKPQPQVEEAVTDKKPKKTKKVSSEDKIKKAKETKKKAKKDTATQDETSFSEDQLLRDRAKTID